MFCLPVFADGGATSLVLIVEEEKKVQLLSADLRVRRRAREGSDSERPSCHISCPGTSVEDGTNDCVFPLAVDITEGKRLSPRTLVGSMYTRLDECVHNITHSMGHYDVVTHVDSSFLRIFLWYQFNSIVRRPVKFEEVTFSDVMIGVW